MVIVVEDIITVQMMKIDDTAVSVGLLGGQGAGAIFSMGIFVFPPLSSE